MSESIHPGEQVAIDQVEQYISFRLADKILMSPLSLIEEVTDPLPVTSIAGTRSWFQGLASKKGRLVPVSDLGDYAIKKPSRYESGAKWLIVTRDTETIGLIVDEVIGLTESGAALQQQTATAPEYENTPLSPLITGVVAVGSCSTTERSDSNEESAVIIDLGRLLTQQRFIRVGIDSEMST